jgi:hypothetical protein
MFYCDGRMSAEVLRILTACDSDSRYHYPKTLFSAEEAYTGSCTAKTTIYCAKIRTTHASLWAEVRTLADRAVERGAPRYRKDDSWSGDEQLWQRDVGNTMPHLAKAYLMTNDAAFASPAWPGRIGREIVPLFTFLYFVSRRHEDERKKKAGPFRPGLWCSALRIYLGKSSSATSATLRSPYIAR